MEKLKRESLIWLLAFVVSAALALCSIGLAVLFSLKLLYAPLAIALVFALHGFYGAPFYLTAWLNRRLIRRMLDNGASDAASASELLGVNAEFSGKLVAIASRRGYIEMTAAVGQADSSESEA